MTDWTGVFGKTPLSGDFVVRGFPARVRRAFDLWITENLTAQVIDGWPDGGLRGLLILDREPVLFIAVPSRDAAGRRFPLAAATHGGGLSYEAAELWCSQIYPTLSATASGDCTVDDLFATAKGLATIPRDAADGEPAVWRAHGIPMTVEPESIAELFSSD